MNSVIISRAAEALEAGDKRLAENYLQLMPLTVKSSARIAVDLFTNAQRELDDDADVESIFYGRFCGMWIHTEAARRWYGDRQTMKNPRS